MTARRTLATFALSAALASPAVAAAPGEFVTRLMGRVPGEGKTFACFSRVYDEPHLAAHPGQNVRSLRVLAVAYSTLDYGYQLRMGFEFRGRPETLTTVAECGHSGLDRQGARCAGPSPGGSMHLALEADGSFLMFLPKGAHLWKPGPPNPQDTVDDAFGPADKRFRLARTVLSACDDQAIDDEEKALLDRDR